jgi:hypothetical protein
MLPSCRHTSLLRRLRSWAMRPPRASSGGKMARLKRTTYSSPTPKTSLTKVNLVKIRMLCNWRTNDFRTQDKNLGNKAADDQNTDLKFIQSIGRSYNVARIRK